MPRKYTRSRLSDDKVEFRAASDWIDRLDAEAGRLGLARSAYIRMVVTQALDSAGQDRRRPPGGSPEEDA